MAITRAKHLDNFIGSGGGSARTTSTDFRIWAGTQAEFDEETEVTDGSVLYIIRS